MQYNNDIEMQVLENSLLFSSPQKNKKKRKWREIEELQARQKLSRELREIDHSFSFSLNDLI